MCVTVLNFIQDTKKKENAVATLGLCEEGAIVVESSRR